MRCIYFRDRSIFQKVENNFSIQTANHEYLKSLKIRNSEITKNQIFEKQENRQFVRVTNLMIRFSRIPKNENMMCAFPRYINILKTRNLFPLHQQILNILKFTKCEFWKSLKIQSSEKQENRQLVRVANLMIRFSRNPTKVNM